jgi:hypothetical protein
VTVTSRRSEIVESFDLPDAEFDTVSGRILLDASDSSGARHWSNIVALRAIRRLRRQCQESR